MKNKLNKLNKNLIKDEEGQSLVQFALILPILIILLSMVVDVWRVYDTKLLMQSAVSEIAVNLVEKEGDYEYKSFVEELMEINYGDRLRKENRKVDLVFGDEKKETFIYHWYTGISNAYYNNYKIYEKKQDILQRYKNATITLNYEVIFWMPLTRLLYGADSIKLSESIVTRVTYD